MYTPEEIAAMHVQAEMRVKELAAQRQQEIQQLVSQYHTQQQPGERLVQTGNSLMKIGCGLTALVWFGIPLLIFFIALIAAGLSA